MFSVSLPAIKTSIPVESLRPAANESVATPSYQAPFQKEFFKNHLPPYTSAQYNTSQNSRGYPDVAANGVNYVVYVDGVPTLVFGTSCSTPVFSSILSTINQARLNIGKSVVGFVNPVLYAHPEMFNDITLGDNPGCGTNGFEAVEGWDPVVSSSTVACFLFDLI